MRTQHTQVNITCWKMHNILLGIYPNPPIKAAPCLPFSWICQVINYFVRIMVKVPMRCQVISVNINLFGVFGGSDYYSYLSWYIWCHCWHQEIWRQVQFYFSSRSWGFWLNFKFLCTVFFRVYICTLYWFSKIMMR